MIQSRIGVPSKEENNKKYVTSLKKWLSKDLVFHPITHANFTEEMVLATVSFDKDNTIYILVPENIFNKD